MCYAPQTLKDYLQQLSDTNSAVPEDNLKENTRAKLRRTAFADRNLHNPEITPLIDERILYCLSCSCTSERKD